MNAPAAHDENLWSGRVEVPPRGNMVRPCSCLMPWVEVLPCLLMLMMLTGAQGAAS